MNPGVQITNDIRTETLLLTLGIKNSSELDLLLEEITKNRQCQELVGRDKIIEHLINYARKLKEKREQGQTQNTQAKQE